MNKRYQKNIDKQKDIQEKMEALRLKQEELKEEQEEMENIEVLKEYRSMDISIDEFLSMMRNYKKEDRKEKQAFRSSESTGGTHTKGSQNQKEVYKDRENTHKDSNIIDMEGNQ